MVIMTTATYREITDYLSSYRGLSIECEEQLVRAFPGISRDTIRSIISKHGQTVLKQLFYKFNNRGGSVVAE